ncbi:MAG: hypothetical protein WDZ49_00170 [Litorilinea sp.]
MINLAPNHKQGLLLSHPLILAAGTVSYGETLPPGLAPRTLGATVGGVVVGPILAESRSGNHGPRLATQAGGLVLDHGNQNRGVRAAVRKFAPLWAALDCTVIVQVADRDVHALGDTLTHLAAMEADVQEFDGLELLLPDTAPIKTLRTFIDTARARYAGPLLVRLPLLRATRLAAVALESGADALVIGEPPQATLPYAGIRTGHHTGRAPAVVSGRFYGPANFGLMLQELIAVRAENPAATLIAAGGIHTPQMAQHALALGAQCVALDSVVWVDPASIGEISAAIAAPAA